MTANQYIEKRAELEGLVSEALEISELHEIEVMKPNLAEPEKPLVARADEALKTVSKKLHENQFQVILVAEFQGGKSTTFNTLIGGREISPRGALVATSATVITAENTSEDSLVDKVEVIWRSKEELLMMIPEHVMVFLKEIYPDKTKLEAVGCAAANLHRLIDLDNDDDRKILSEALDKEWQYYQKEKSSYSLDSLSMLSTSRLVLAHYGTSYIEQLRQKTGPVFMLSAIPDMVQFPRHWEVRKSEPQKIQTKESVFVFVKKVICYVRSESLAKMGCRIVDCPGLFNSRYDTQVALDEIQRSDAVWFLLGGKGISDSVLKQIKKIHQIKPENLLFSVNIHESTLKHTKELIIPNNVAKLNEYVFKKPIDARVFFTYHARLALTAVQAKLFMTDRLDENSKRMLSDLFVRCGGDDEVDGVGEMLCINAEDDLRSIGQMSHSDLRKFDLMTEEGLAEARRQSALDEIVAHMEEIVLRRKAKTILVTEGTQRITQALGEVEQLLRRKEELESRNAEERQKLCDDTIKKLRDFKGYCDEKLNGLHVDSFARALSCEFREKVLDPTIAETVQQVQATLSQVEDVQGCLQREGLLQSLVMESFANSFEVYKRVWAEGLTGGESRAVADFRDQVDVVCESLRDRWSVIVPQDQGGQYDGALVLSGKNPLDVEVAQSGDFFAGSCIKADFLDSCGPFVITGAAGLAWAFLTGPVGLLVAGATFIGGMMGLNARSENKKQSIIQNVIASVRKGLDASVRGQESKVEVGMMEVAAKLKDELLKHFSASIGAKVSELQREQEAQRKALLMSQDELKAQQERSRILREERIAPIRKRIEAFETGVGELL